MKLDILNLSFERDNNFLFEKISQRLVSGDCLQVTGANGSGKSTLLRLLAGFIQPEPETVFWNDECVTKNRVSYQRHIHYLGHHSGIRAHLTVKENLALNAALFGGVTSAIDAVCEKARLQKHKDKLAANLSAGQRQRLALARLLLVKQPLWILDEPITALDKDGREYFREFLSEHLDAGGIAVMATHHEYFERAKTCELGDKNV